MGVSQGTSVPIAPSKADSLISATEIVCRAMAIYSHVSGEQVAVGYGILSTWNFSFCQQSSDCVS